MKELIWLNGRTMPLSQARVSVEDRGFQFADGVYEVIRVYQGRAYTLREHMDRLERSCLGISLPPPIPKAKLAAHIHKLIAKSALDEGMVYVQITRGTCPRNHVFPKSRPTVLFYTRQLPPMDKPRKSKGLKLITVPDERWNRCWIKSIALLPNVLAKNAAIAAGADEAAFVRDGIVTECATSNLFIVARGSLLTHPVGPSVLPGVTRSLLLDLAAEAGVDAVERPISEGEILAADEVFITSTTRELAWVSHWNGKRLGRAKCGPVTLQLHHAYQKRVAETLPT